MRHRFTGFIVMGAILTLAPLRAPAQTPALPRMPDGKPNLQGIWQVLNTAAWDVQDHSARLLREGVVMGAVTTERTPVPGCRVQPLGVMRYVPVVSTAHVTSVAAVGLHAVVPLGRTTSWSASRDPEVSTTRTLIWSPAVAATRQQSISPATPRSSTPAYPNRSAVSMIVFQLQLGHLSVEKATR